LFFAYTLGSGAFDISVLKSMTNTERQRQVSFTQIVLFCHQNSSFCFQKMLLPSGQNLRKSSLQEMYF